MSHELSYMLGDDSVMVTALKEELRKPTWKKNATRKWAPQWLFHSLRK